MEPQTKTERLEPRVRCQWWKEGATSSLQHSFQGQAEFSRQAIEGLVCGAKVAPGLRHMDLKI